MRRPFRKAISPSPTKRDQTGSGRPSWNRSKWRSKSIQERPKETCIFPRRCRPPASPRPFPLTGTISLSESSSSLAAEEPYSVHPAFQFEGEIDTNNLRLREAADFFGPRPVPQQLQGGASLQSHIRVAPGVAGYDVVLTKIAANVDELAVTGKANMAGLLTSQPTFSITFAAPSIDLRQLFARIPAQWIHAQLPALVERRQLGGTVEILSATLTGATAPSPQLSLTGDFRIDKGTALIGNDLVPTQDLTATVSVEPGRIRVGKLSGEYGNLTITDGKTVVSFLDDGPRMELDISGDMTAADLVKFLTKTIRADKLTSLLAQSREIEGRPIRRSASSARWTNRTASPSRAGRC